MTVCGGGPYQASLIKIQVECGRIWNIKYEGLKMICFNSGKQGHREDSCPLKEPMRDTNGQVGQQNQIPTEGTTQSKEQATYGSWMIVRKPRRKFTKQGQNAARVAKTTTEEVQQANNIRTKRGEMSQRGSGRW